MGRARSSLRALVFQDILVTANELRMGKERADGERERAGTEVVRQIAM